jgi:2,3-bisphosphoglycerate-independent phosphoglycerate mutase
MMAGAPIQSPDQRRCIVLILDGLGDLPVDALGGLTPLEAARTPNMDRMASAGRYGLVDPIAPGVTPNTHTGVGTLFGLRPEQQALLKRGPVEAAGADVPLNPGDIAFRANLATLEMRDGRLYVADRRAGRVIGDSAQFARELECVDLGDGVTARFWPTDQHRGALVLSGPGLGAALGDTDPGDRGSPGWVEPCRSSEPGSDFAAAKVDRFIAMAHERLKDHPLNRERVSAGRLPVTGVITRGAGAWFELDGVLAGRGYNPVLVVGCNTVSGLAKLFDMGTVMHESFTAGTDTNVGGKLAAAATALSDSALVFVHIKAPDLYSHDFMPGSKRDFLEKVDSELDVLMNSGAAIALSADHTTDSNTGAHAADPVPAFFYEPGAIAGRVSDSFSFGESACRNGSFSRRTGHQFLLDIQEYLDGQDSSFSAR